MENKRQEYIDLFRGIAIFLVTGFHLSTQFFNTYYPGMAISFALGNAFLQGRIGIHIFIVISGYVFSLSQTKTEIMTTRQYGTYIFRRFLRIAPAYYVAIIIFNFISSNQLSLIDNVTHIFFVHNFSIRTFFKISPAFWYLGVQMQLYVIAPLLLLALKKKPVITLILAAVVSVICCSGFLEKLGITNIIIICSTFSYMVLFCIGIMLYRKRVAIQRMLENKLILLFIVSMSLYLLLVADIYSYGFLTELSFIILGTLICILIPFCAKRPFIEKSKILFPFIQLGKYSYSIFLYNYIFMISKPLCKGYAGYLFYFMFVFTVGICMYFLVEKPSQVFVKKYFRT